ncbi:MAG: YbaB/EbfC family nucleoid-associated protein [Nitrospirae bacterium]|nr:YbaB/EbfC family nucleoid-associated protein [Nitrospirota bacterium]
MGQLMRQAQEMQTRMGQLQEQAARLTVSASAGGGMVTVTANGKQEVTALAIDPSVVNPDDVEMLQDLILAAIAEAQRKSREQLDLEVQKLTGGLNIPGLGGGLGGLF